MADYLVTGGTGFLGRHLLDRLLAREQAQVHVVVRQGSLSRWEQIRAGLSDPDRVHTVIGDLTEPGLGLGDGTRSDLQGVDHVVHLAALYDMTAGEERNRQVNVVGTQHVVDLARELSAGRLHHVSSVAVAGAYRGTFTEAMFDEGQPLPSPYHATKYAAEEAVRAQSDVPWRVYRPAIVVGSAQTGVMDKVDGPYYFFPALAALASLPAIGHLPLVLPDLGASNAVPVDWVAEAMDALIHAPGLDGRAFHLVSPKPQRLLDVYNSFASAAGAPTVRLQLDKRLLLLPMAALGLASRLPGVQISRDLVLQRMGIPPEVLPHLTFECAFASTQTQQALAAAGVQPPPELETYAGRLWDYWTQHLDPLRARRRTGDSELAGRTVAITGASSGIGKATALAVARRGGVPLLLARRAEELEKVKAEVEEAGGSAWVYTVDLTSQESAESCAKQMLADHGGVDMLVNNAGRSIRRSVGLSLDRFHDVERTIALNYFAPVRLLFQLLPSMTQRRFGHIVNISSIGVQSGPPRFSAYVASKAALDAFSRVVSSEVVGDGITFTTVHMPLVRTPMIAPTRLYDAFPALTPEQAADLVVRALEERPKHVGTPLGTVAEVAYAVAPKVVDAVMHAAFIAFPDSTAAGGDGGSPAQRAPEALSRGASVLVRLLPGVHW